MGDVVQRKTAPATQELMESLYNSTGGDKAVKARVASEICNSLFSDQPHLKKIAVSGLSGSQSVSAVYSGQVLMGERPYHSWVETVRVTVLQSPNGEVSAQYNLTSDFSVPCALFQNTVTALKPALNRFKDSAASFFDSLSADCITRSDSSKPEVPVTTTYKRTAACQRTFESEPVQGATQKKTWTSPDRSGEPDLDMVIDFTIPLVMMERAVSNGTSKSATPASKKAK